MQSGWKACSKRTLNVVNNERRREENNNDVPDDTKTEPKAFEKAQSGGPFAVLTKNLVFSWLQTGRSEIRMRDNNVL